MADRGCELGEVSIVLEALAGLARVEFGQGCQPQAQAYADDILAHLDAGGSLEGAWEPLSIYLSCFRVLEVSRDERAASVLAAAHRQLQQQAAQIGDEQLRRSFLENVPAHREIVREYARQRSCSNE